MLNFSLASRSSQLGKAYTNEITHAHSGVVYVVFETKYDKSFKAYVNTMVLTSK